MTDTKKYIAENARVLFSIYGPQTVTIDEIVSYCRISKKTLYRFYENKEILIVYILQNLFEESTHLWRSDNGVKHGTLAELDRFFNTVQIIVTVVTPVFFNGIKKQSPMGYRLFAEFKTFTLAPRLRKIIQTGQSEGIFKAEIECETTVEIYFQLLKDSLANISDFFNEKPLSIQLFHTFFLQALLQPVRIAL